MILNFLQPHANSNAIGLFIFISAAFLTTIDNRLPVAFPFFTPGKAAFTDGAYFFW